jgi:hypothetical protein
MMPGLWCAKLHRRNSLFACLMKVLVSASLCPPLVLVDHSVSEEKNDGFLAWSLCSYCNAHDVVW